MRSPNVRWRRGLYADEVRELAEPFLDIRVRAPRPVVRCPSCGNWGQFLQIEGHEWRCKECAVESCKGLLKRLAWFSSYIRCGVFNRNARALRRRLIWRLVQLSRRATSVDHLVTIAMGSLLLGDFDLGWTGFRRRSRRSVARGISQGAHGLVDQTPAERRAFLQAVIEQDLSLSGYAANAGVMVAPPRYERLGAEPVSVATGTRRGFVSHSLSTQGIPWP